MTYNLLAINDSYGTFNFPTPSTYNAITSTLVDGARNTSGVYVGTYIRELAKVEMCWRYLSASDWANILKQFSPNNNGNFVRTITYLDQTTNTYLTKEMYVSDRKAGGFKYDDETGILQGYTECSLSLVEV